MRDSHWQTLKKFHSLVPISQENDLEGKMNCQTFNYILPNKDQNTYFLT